MATEIVDDAIGVEVFPVFKSFMKRLTADIKSQMSQLEKQLGVPLEQQTKKASERAGREGAKSYGAAFKKGLKTALKGAAVGIGLGLAAAVGILPSAVRAASDLAETVNKSNVIFGENAAEIEAWASTAARSVGLSKQAALESAASFGNMLSQLGFTGDQAADMSTQIVQLSADLGSFNNLPTAEVADMISAAFRGEYDSLQRLIPNINAARVEQEALAMTGKSTAKELTAAERAAATLAIVQRDGAAAAGDFAETSGGLANSQKILAAEVENLKARIGNALAPAMAMLVAFITARVLPALGQMWEWIEANIIPALVSFAGWVRREVLPVLQEFGSWILNTVVPAIADLGQELAMVLGPALQSAGAFIRDTLVPALQTAVTWLGENETVVKAVGIAIGALIVVTKLHTAAMAVQAAGGILTFLGNYLKNLTLVKVATAAWTAVQWLLNIALNANPIGLVIAALALLVGGLIYAWRNSETFRNIVTAVWNAVVTGAIWLKDMVVNAVKTVIDWVRANWPLLLALLTGPFAPIVIIIMRHWSTLVGGLRAGWNAINANVIQPLVAGFGWARDRVGIIASAIAGFFAGIPGAVGAAFGNIANAVLTPVRGLIRWLNRNLIGKLNWVTSKFGWTIKDIPIGFNKGGVIPGGGPDRDSVMTPMTPGEGVINRKGTRKLGSRVIAAINSGMVDFNAVRSAVLGNLPKNTDFGMAEGGFWDDVSNAWSAVTNGDAGNALPGWMSGAAQAVEAAEGMAKAALGAAFDAVIGLTGGLPGGPIPKEMAQSWLRKAKEEVMSWGDKQDKGLAGHQKSIGSLAGVGALSPGGWMTPLAAGSYRVGRGSAGHGYNAQDLPAPTGTSIMSAQSGKVLSVRHMNTSYGNHVRVAHAGGMQTLYAHMSSTLASVGRAVKRGSIIGRVGSTGNSTGPHLHLEILRQGTRLNPSNYFRFDQAAGGVLKRGWNQIYNGTGGPERLVPKNSKYGENLTVNLVFPNGFVGSPKEFEDRMVSTLTNADRSGRLNGLRSFARGGTR